MPDYIFKEDAISGRNYQVYCLLCKCWLQSAITFNSHRQGKKHVKKQVKLFNDVYGIEPSVGVSRPAVKAKDDGSAAATGESLRKPLAERLKMVADLFLGLEFG